jgi:L-threonylcarbamoyladenylate synthase
VALPVTRDVDRAVAALRAGDLVALPTETVYGLAGDASSLESLSKIFRAKGRPAHHPVIVHVASADEVGAWATDVPPWARLLMDTLWPGPLTVIVPRSSHVLDAVTGGQSTVGLRVPAHPLTLDVLDRFGGGLAAPSANRYGRVSPTTAADVVADLGDQLDSERDLVLDGGPCEVGVESTIVGAWDAVPRLLRPGAVTSEQIRDITGLTPDSATDGVRAPGSTASHYAPRAQVVVVDAAELNATIEQVVDRHRVAVIALAEVASDPQVTRLAAPVDADEYAQELYAALRKADVSGMDLVIAVPPPATGVGHAVRDRLNRAATDDTSAVRRAVT